jgi:hypothetical protein
VVLSGLSLDGWTSEEVEALKAAMKQTISFVTGIPVEYFGDVTFVFGSGSGSGSGASTASIVVKRSAREVDELRCHVALDCPAEVS